MRSRFVDYHGTYVMHCHILIHEDRGMMFTVSVVPPPTLMVHHH
jgi:FtsP/CotA-like multicopper oxidase with cupredoxin domain